MRARRAAAVLVAALAMLPAGCAGAQRPAPVAYTRADTAALHRVLDSLAAGHHGIVGYAVHNLDTGERLALRGDETFPSASLIKVPILVTVYDLVDKGMLSLDDPLTVLRIDQVPGSGTLQWMHPGFQLSVHDAAWLMSTISDNTATNLLLDRIAIRRVWAKMDSLGLHNTKVHSKVYLRLASVAPDSSVKYGLGVTTPNEMARLFELLARGQAVNARADSAMLDILAHNEDIELMQRFNDSIPVAHKTGAVDRARNECALYTLQSRVVVCVMTRENVDERYLVDNEAHVLIARAGQAVWRSWPRRVEPTSVSTK
jgi:beta-lactamase class A